MAAWLVLSSVTSNRHMYNNVQHALAVDTAALRATALYKYFINVKKLNSLKQCLTATRPTSHN